MSQSKKQELDYWTRRAWREWFEAIDRDMDANLGIWLRIYVWNADE